MNRQLRKLQKQKYNILNDQTNETSEPELHENAFWLHNALNNMNQNDDDSDDRSSSTSQFSDEEVVNRVYNAGKMNDSSVEFNFKVVGRSKPTKVAVAKIDYEILRSTDAAQKDTHSECKTRREITDSICEHFNIELSNFEKPHGDKKNTVQNCAHQAYCLNSCAWFMLDSPFVQAWCITARNRTFKSNDPRHQVHLKVQVIDRNNVQCKLTDLGLKSLLSCLPSIKSIDMYTLMREVETQIFSIEANLSMAQYHMLQGNYPQAHEHIANAVSGVQAGLSHRFPIPLTSKDLLSNKTSCFHPVLTKTEVASVKKELQQLSMSNNPSKIQDNPSIGNALFLRILWFYCWSAGARAQNIVAFELCKMMLLLNPYDDLSASLLLLPIHASKVRKLKTILVYAQYYVEYAALTRDYAMMCDFAKLVNILSNNAYYAMELNFEDLSSLNSKEVLDVVDHMLCDNNISTDYILENKELSIVDESDSTYGTWAPKWYNNLLFFIPNFAFSVAATAITSKNDKLNNLIEHATSLPFNVKKCWEFINKLMTNMVNVKLDTLTSIVHYLSFIILMFPDFPEVLAEVANVNKEKHLAQLKANEVFSYAHQYFNDAKLQETNEKIMKTYVTITINFWRPMFRLVLMCYKNARELQNTMKHAKSPLKNPVMLLQLAPKFINGELILRYSDIQVFHFSQNLPTCPIEIH